MKGRSLTFLCAAMIAAPAAGQSSSVPPAGYGAPIGVTKALAIIQRGMEQSSTKGFRMAFAVVEPSGELVAFARTDDAPYASTRLAEQKAKASARLRLPTSTLEKRVLDGRTVLMSSDEVIAVGGGVLIVENGKIIGALGVSGGTSAEDTQIAEFTVAPN